MGLGLAALGFGLDWVRALVSMATDSYNEEKLLTTLAPSVLIGSSLFLQVSRTTIKSWMSSKFVKYRPGTAELTALERLDKFS